MIKNVIILIISFLVISFFLLLGKLISERYFISTNILNWYKIFICFISIGGAYFIYKAEFLNKELFFKGFIFCFLFLFFELLFTYIIDYKKYYGITIHGKEIGYDLKLQQQTYADSAGINKFINDKNTPLGYIINKEGFSSRYEFTKQVADSLKRISKVIMFIGDSHTEGYCADPITHSFTNLIDQNKNFSALNVGVGGTDPLQYKLIAEQYIPKLLPDMVIVALCLDNDFMHYDRKPAPLQPLHFQTNYNWLNATLPESHPDFAPDKYFENWDAAKSYYLENYTITGKDIHLLEKIFIIPSNFNSFLYYLSTALKKYFNLKKSIEKYGKNISVNFKLSDNDITYRHLTTIREICKEQKVDFKLFGVPTIKDMALNQDSVYLKYQTVLKDLHLYYPRNFVSNDFVSERNDHFNNKGHEKFAEFLDSIISDYE